MALNHIHLRRVAGIAAGWVIMSLALAQSSLIPAEVQLAAKDHITAAALEASVRFLASDALEGRGPATRGDELARAYLATQLQGLGLKPGGPNGQWQQPFDIVGTTTQASQTWRFEAKGKSVDLKYHDEFIAASGVQQDSAAIDDAEVVFAGYGIQAPEFKWDDFKGMDLKGKVLVMLNNDPDWDPKLFAGNRRLYYGRWIYKYESGARQGAAAVIIIHTTPSAGYPWQVVQSSWSGEQFQLPAGDEPRLQFQAWTTEDAARRLFAAAGQNLDKLIAAARQRSFKPVRLSLRTSLRAQNKIARVQTANVAGLLPGSDPKLKDEVVIYSAHHDHLGIGEPDSTGDRIYNGAVDNASGCAQVLALARAMSALPTKPRRSILFLFVAAEEQGLIGSQYYAQHPTFPIGKIAADLNYDIANIRGRTKDVSFIDLGKSSLDAVAHSAIGLQGRQGKPGQFPDRGTYYRSDHFSFAKVGVPSLSIKGGIEFVGKPVGWGKQQVERYEAKNYHQPSDQIDDSWNYDGMIEDTQLGLYMGWLIAQADAMPTWNPGDEFEAVRKKSLERHLAQ
jgi:Zn-dependent M28 family amino/carboxypeptidase